MKFIKFILLSTLFPFIFMSCSDDSDNDIESIGTLTVNGAVYELSYGVIYNRGQWETWQGYNFDVDLVSLGLDIETETGSGHIVALEMSSVTTNDLNDGTYTFNEEEFPAGTFCGIIITNGNSEIEGSGTFYIITSGSIKVAKSGDVYEFTMNVLAVQLDENLEDTVATDVPISCYYKGVLKKEDF